MKKRLVACLLALCLGLVPLATTGCRNSDALKEVIIDQTSSNIDYENENKYLINDASSSIKDSRVAALESDNNGRVTEEKQNIVVYSSDPNAPQYRAKQSVWSSDPDFQGLEASSTVSFYDTDDPNAPLQDIGAPPEPEEPEEEEEEEQEEQEKQEEEEEKEQQDRQEEPIQNEKNSETGNSGTGPSPSRGNRTSSEGKEKTEKQTDSGGGKDNKDDEEPEEEEDPTEVPDGGDGEGEDPGDSGIDDTPAPVEDSSGNYTQLPTVDHIAAVGQLAVVVQMIGGEGALVAADANLLSSEFSAVFADEGAASIVQAWPDYGSPETIDMDAIEASGAQLLMVDTPNFTELMPSDQRKKLNKLLEDGTIKKVMYADISNSSSIKSFVRKVGKSLNESTTIGNAGNTEQIANDYITFHDELVRQCAAINGGLAYDATSGEETVYELGGNTGQLSSGEQLAFNGNAKYTLLLDEWDDSVRYIYGDVWNPQMSGIALSYAGYSDTPVSYYMQAGGLVNNAAARGSTADPGMYPVWQFSSLPVLKDSSYAQYAVGGAFDNSATPVTKRSAGTAWDTILLTTSCNLSLGSANSGTSYGTTLFPKLIAATQTIKQNMIANSDGAEEAYHPFDTITDDVRGARGYIAADESIVYSCIGSVGSTEAQTRTIGESIGEDDIVVNPHGLFSSWTEYGSVEGVLETAWVNDVVNGASAVDWRSKVIDFYATFYRYDCSGDMATIENGIVG